MRRLEMSDAEFGDLTTVVKGHRDRFSRLAQQVTDSRSKAKWAKEAESANDLLTALYDAETF